MMKTHPFIRRAGALLWLLAAGLGSRLSAGDTVVQSIPLSAGWNSVWLEVQPANDAPAAVLAGLPLESAWTFAHRESAVDFIEDPSEPVWNRDRWLSWVPSGPAAVANNLFAISGHRAYLIKLTNAATLTVTGRPGLRAVPWKPEAFNLRGFPVDPGAPPTFRSFFSPAPAHFDTTANRPRSIYRLNSSGVWQQIAPTDLMESGVAYWVFSKGGSDFTAPFEARVELGGDSLDLGRNSPEAVLQLVNRRATPANATVGQIPHPAVNPVAYARFNPTNGTEWLDFPSLLTRTVQAGVNDEIRVAPRRQLIDAAGFSSIIEIRDNAGTRQLVVFSATGGTAEEVAASSSSSVAKAAKVLTPEAEAKSHAGLWVGVASIQKVSENHSGTLVTNRVASDGTPLEITRTGNTNGPTPVKAAFPLRLLIHVDTNGTARLLREVTQMWQDGTYAPDTNGNLTVATGGRPVLVTDSSKLSRYKGVSTRGDALTGRRFSSVGYDFPGSGPTQGDNFLPLAGLFAMGRTNSATIRMNPEFATNPFRHKYHPDHDNLDNRFTDFKAEAYEVVRVISLEFSGTDPGESTSGAAPDYGYNNLAGTYRETITGLHKFAINTEGLFRLKRISDATALNP